VFLMMVLSLLSSIGGHRDAQIPHPAQLGCPILDCAGMRAVHQWLGETEWDEAQQAAVSTVLCSRCREMLFFHQTGSLLAKSNSVERREGRFEPKRESLLVTSNSTRISFSAFHSNLGKFDRIGCDQAQFPLPQQVAEYY
jgi:hypothetical protein